MEMLFILGCLAILIVSIIVVSVIIFCAINKFFNLREARRKKLHPRYFELIEEINDLGKKYHLYWRKEVSDRKEEIKRILNNMDYLPTEKIEKAQEELEDLRMDLFNAQAINRRNQEHLQNKRDELSEYMIKHGIEKWG